MLAGWGCDYLQGALIGAARRLGAAVARRRRNRRRAADAP